MQSLIEECYTANYLIFYYEMWKKIQESKNREVEIKNYWNILSKKRFSINDFVDRTILYKQQEKLIDYLKNRLHISKEHITDRMKWIENTANVKFYNMASEGMPKLVEIAVKSTIKGRSNIEDEEYSELVEKALKKIKELRFFL